MVKNDPNRKWSPPLNEVEEVEEARYKSKPRFKSMSACIHTSLGVRGRNRTRDRELAESEIFDL